MAQFGIRTLRDQVVFAHLDFDEEEIGRAPCFSHTANKRLPAVVWVQANDWLSRSSHVLYFSSHMTASIRSETAARSSSVCQISGAKGLALRTISSNLERTPVFKVLHNRTVSRSLNDCRPFIHASCGPCFQTRCLSLTTTAVDEIKIRLHSVALSKQ